MQESKEDVRKNKRISDKNITSFMRQSMYISKDKLVNK